MRAMVMVLPLRASGGIHEMVHKIAQPQASLILGKQESETLTAITIATLHK